MLMTLGFLCPTLRWLSNPISSTLAAWTTSLTGRHRHRRVAVVTHAPQQSIDLYLKETLPWIQAPPPSGMQVQHCPYSRFVTGTGVRCVVSGVWLLPCLTEGACTR